MKIELVELGLVSEETKGAAFASLEENVKNVQSGYDGAGDPEESIT